MVSPHAQEWHWYHEPVSPTSGAYGSSCSLDVRELADEYGDASERKSNWMHIDPPLLPCLTLTGISLALFLHTPSLICQLRQTSLLWLFIDTSEMSPATQVRPPMPRATSLMMPIASPRPKHHKKKDWPSEPGQEADRFRHTHANLFL